MAQYLPAELDTIDPTAYKVSADTQASRDQVSARLLEEENKTSRFPNEDIPANNRRIAELQKASYTKWNQDKPQYLPATMEVSDEPKYLPAMTEEEQVDTNSMKYRGQAALGAITGLLVKPALGGLNAGRHAIGAMTKGEFGIDKLAEAGLKGMEEVNDLPGLKSTTPGEKDFDQALSDIIEGSGGVLAKALYSDLSPFRELAKLNEPLADTLAHSIPSAGLIGAIGGIGRGVRAVTNRPPTPLPPRPQVEPTIAPMKGPEGSQGVLPLDQPVQSTTLPPDYAEKTKLAQTPPEKITPPGDMFHKDNIDKIREQRMAMAEQAIKQEAARVSQGDLVKQAEVEDSYRKRVYEFEKTKRLEEDAAFAQDEARRESESVDRQRLIDYRFEEERPTAMSQAFKEAMSGVGKKEGGAYTPFREGGDEFLKKMLTSIHTMPESQLINLKNELKKTVDSMTFEDNSNTHVYHAYQDVLKELDYVAQDKQTAANRELKQKLIEKHNLSEGKIVDFTMNRDTGYETNHTGKVVEFNNDPDHVYVRDNFSERLYQLNGHEIDKVFTGPSGVIKSPGNKQGGMWKPFEKGEDADLMNQLLYGNTRLPTQEVINHLEKIFPGKDADIHPGLISNTANAHWRSHNRLMYGLDKEHAISAAIAQLMDNNIRLAVREEHALNFEAVTKANNSLRDSYNFGHLTKIPRYNDFIRDVKVYKDMTKLKDEWFTGKDYYPPDQWLIDKGVIPENIPAWRNVFEIEMKLYDRVATAVANNGGKMVPRVPGYLHSEWTGPYRVEIYKEHLDPKTGEITKEYQDKAGFYTKKAMEKAYDAEMKRVGNDPSITISKVFPKAEGMDNASLIKDYAKLAKQFEQSPGLRDVILRFHDTAMKSIITESLARKDTQVGGHTLDRIAADKNSIYGLNHSQLRDAFEMFRNHFEEVNGFYVRSKFVNEVLIPLQESNYLQDRPNLSKQIARAFTAYARLPEGTGAIDTALRGLAIHFGKDPAMAEHMANAGTHGISAAYLIFNLRYILGNVFQRINNGAYLHTIHAQQEALGLPTGSILKAYFDTVKEYNMLMKLSADNPKLPANLRRAIKEGGIDPGFNESINPGQVYDPIAVAVERRNRAAPYMLAYNYAKQFMNAEDAHAFGMKHADAIGVPYQAQFGPQMMYQGMASIAKPAVIFTNYSSHIMSMQNNMMHTMYKTAEMKDIKPLMEASAALTGWQLAAAGIFGIGGVNFVKNLDDIINWWSATTGEYHMTSQDWARKIDKFIPDSMKGIPSLGSLSKILGFDVSGGGSGANVQGPTAGVNMAMAAVYHGVLGFKELSYFLGTSNKPVTKEDWGEVRRKSPGRIGSFDEYMIKYGGDIFKMSKDLTTGDFPTNPDRPFRGKQDSSLEKNITDQGYPRNKLESWIMLSTAIRSFNESQENTADRLTGFEKKTLDDLTKAIGQEAREHGHLTQRGLQTMLQISKEFGPDKLEGIVNSIIDTKITSLMPNETRKLYESLDSIEKYKFYQKYKARLLGGKK